MSYYVILSLTCTSKFHIDTIYRSKDMMIRMRILASELRVLWRGIRIWMCDVVYARRNWCTRNCTVRGERRADGERFCFTSRSWFGVCIAKISPKKLGDYNSLITGI